MTLIIQKFGGSSVGSFDKIRHVADLVMAERARGHQLVVVLSAMEGETDRLIAMGKAMDDKPHPRELDLLLATGEQVSTALLAITLRARGVEARALTGQQAGIQTNDQHQCARIVDIDSSYMMNLLDQDCIPIVTGFQGYDALGNITTLGRGGSDTTAVALAAKLKAEACHIYTDVDGVYTTDPRIEPKARRMEKVTFEEMLEMAGLGAKVLQIRSVEFAGKYNVPLKVLSTFQPGPGTIITYEEDESMEEPVVSGVVLDRNQAKITIRGVPDKPGNAMVIMGTISDHHINADMIVQNVPSEDGTIDFSFTVTRDDYDNAMRLIEAVSEEIGAGRVMGDDKVAKLSIVGVGMRSHAGVATTMFEVLAREGINIQLVATSEIKVSVIVDEKYIELGVRSLHEAYGLGSDPDQ